MEDILVTLTNGHSYRCAKSAEDSTRRMLGKDIKSIVPYGKSKEAAAPVSIENDEEEAPSARESELLLLKATELRDILDGLEVAYSATDTKPKLRELILDHEEKSGK